MRGGIKMILSDKAKAIEPSLTLDITAKAKKMKDDGIDVVGFGAGEPDFNTPTNIQNAAINAIKNGKTKYTPASGILELKRAICKKLKYDNNIDYNEMQIIISTGAKQCLANVFQAILNPGDEVLLAVPYWVSYPELIKLADGIPVFVETTEESKFKYDISILQNYVNNKTKVIIINSPNNPTGTVYTKSELYEIAEFAREHDLLIISDEIYEKLIYDNKGHISIASLNEDAYNRTIVINGVSKSYSMTGWRIGYAAGNEEIIRLMTRIQSHTTSNPNSIAQYASLEAILGEQDTIKSMINEFKSRRDYMVSRINSINNLSCVNPEGAFYVMVNIKKLINKTLDNEIIKNSMDFSKILLEKYRVAVIPGVAFGQEGFIRLSYATSMDNIKKGIDRLEKFVATI